MAPNGENRGRFSVWFKASAAVAATIAGLTFAFVSCSNDLVQLARTLVITPTNQQPSDRPNEPEETPQSGAKEDSPESRPKEQDMTTEEPTAVQSDAAEASPKAPASASVPTATSVASASAASAESSPLAVASAQTSLREGFYQQVGNYTLQVVNTNPNTLGATEALVAEYRSPEGVLIYYFIWAYSSSVEAEQGRQVLVGRLQSQGFVPAEEFYVQDVQGSQVGTGVRLTGSTEQITWTHNNYLAGIGAPLNFGADFYRTLYGI